MAVTKPIEVYPFKYMQSLELQSSTFGSRDKTKVDISEVDAF